MHTRINKAHQGTIYQDFIKTFKICQQTKVYRKNLDQHRVTTETSKTPFERIKVDTRNSDEKSRIDHYRQTHKVL